MSVEPSLKSSFIYNIIGKDVEQGINDGRVHTRFPPEPNGYLHIGHAKAMLLNYSVAKAFNGKFNLRFDDTNPTKEEQEFVDSIIADIKWLGADWEERLFFSSDSFELKYEFATKLIKAGIAYVCDLNADNIREYRGTLTEPGKNSPYRNRTIDENLELFQRMRNGDFPAGSRVLRAKIDMSSGNLNMRDPVIYRILFAHHHRTKDKWCIYPMYDFDHPLTDVLEGVTHSMCSIEYTDHRPLYDWVVSNALELMPDNFKTRSRQIEFARLNMTYTVMSKRKLRRLVEEGYVNGWDDPRMPTIAGLRRRGVNPSAISDFLDRVGVARSDSTIDLSLFEYSIRNDLESTANRVMVVLDPIKVVITNFEPGIVEYVELENMPDNPDAGTRLVPISREIYIDRDDFMESPPKKFHRLYPGGEVRLKGAFIVKCEEIIKDSNGNIEEIQCAFDPLSRKGLENSSKKVKGVIHWVSAEHALNVTVRLYNNLFNKENPEETAESDFLSEVNTASLVILENAKAEPSLIDSKTENRYQFMRKGYFCLDSVDSKNGDLVYNQIVGLKDSWGKTNK